MQSDSPRCRCGEQPLQGRERQDTGGGAGVRAGSRRGARRSSPTPPPPSGVANVFAKGLRVQFQRCGPVVPTATTRSAVRGQAAPGHADAWEWLRHAETPLTDTETCDKRLVVFKYLGLLKTVPTSPATAHVHGKEWSDDRRRRCRVMRGRPGGPAVWSESPPTPLRRHPPHVSTGRAVLSAPRARLV